MSGVSLLCHSIPFFYPPPPPPSAPTLHTTTPTQPPTLLFFNLVLLLFKSCHFSANGPVSVLACFVPEHSPVLFRINKQGS